ncbi:MAG: DUF2513 domain-containing protein [Bacteroidetes bacterium]|nr:MAG: DUF2513 domain-containing protein [Bacteroidota bacterium]
MKRDKELIREILLFTESQKPLFSLSFNNKYDSDCSYFPGYKNGDVSQHYKLLIDDEYLNGKYLENEGGIICSIIAIEIKMKGYNLLDSIRDTGIWSEVKNGLGIAGESWNLELIAKLGTKIIANKIGLLK